ncbi:MAG TPA: TlpA disulfide reductase family protein, partial [Pirellulales bacterium]|nr:TlpA disulfide reductase family protein [Pirellulales bacterium]
MAAGCHRATEAKPSAQELQPPRTAKQILERVVETYHQADRYQDSGRLLVRYEYRGEVVSETKDFSLAVSGPNRLRMRAYDALVVCDGQNLRGTLDESPREVLTIAAPAELTAAAVYQDPVLGKALNQIVGSVPLALFLDPDPLPLLLANSRTPRLASPRKIGDAPCYCVQIERREGAFVLWIDQRTLVVRRVEYPADGYRRLIEPLPGDITKMTITAELEGACLDPPIDDAIFEFKTPEGASLVKRFEDVRLGARIPDFKLRTLDGQTISRDSLAGKTAVIKFWQKDDVLTYYHDLSSFEEVQRRYQDEDSVVFLAVSADSDGLTDDELQAALTKADLSLPIARADYRVAFRSFGLQIVPTTIILGPDGRLQERVVGVYPNQATTLAQNLDTVLAGGDLSLEAPLNDPESYLFSGYEWQSIPSIEEESQPATTVDLAQAEIAPAKEPGRLRRKKLWNSAQLQQPGNLLIVPSATGSDRVFVIEGLPRVAELGPDGTVLAKHRLELPDRDDSAVTFLRTAADANGHRYFLGSKAGVQQVHLFDDQWKRLLSFPEAADHPGIADALLADLNGDGELEMAVGYAEAVGVHSVTLEGERLWRNPAAETVLRLDVTGPDRRGQRQLLVAEGLILPIDADGNDWPEIASDDLFVRLVFTADLDGDGAAEWCTIAMKWMESGKLGSTLAAGFSSRGEEQWRYSLPDGEQRHPAFEM